MLGIRYQMIGHIKKLGGSFKNHVFPLIIKLSSSGIRQMKKLFDFRKHFLDCFWLCPCWHHNGDGLWFFLLFVLLQGLINFWVNENVFNSERISEAIEKIKAAKNKSSQGRIILQTSC